MPKDSLWGRGHCHKGTLSDVLTPTPSLSPQILCQSCSDGEPHPFTTHSHPFTSVPANGEEVGGEKREWGAERESRPSPAGQAQATLRKRLCVLCARHAYALRRRRRARKPPISARPPTYAARRKVGKTGSVELAGALRLQLSDKPNVSRIRMLTQEPFREFLRQLGKVGAARIGEAENLPRLPGKPGKLCIVAQLLAQ